MFSIKLPFVSTIVPLEVSLFSELLSAILFLFTISLISCSESSLIIDISESKSSLDYRHYEQDLFNINTEDLSGSLDKLAPRYPVFINGNYKDPTKLVQLENYLRNDLNIKLFNDWDSKIGNYNKMKEELLLLLLEFLLFDVESFFSDFSMNSSERVFHSLQELHCPCHFECWVPQIWQKKVVLTLLIIYK